EPKTFAGLFGAAPSVGIGTLTLAYLHEGRPYVAVSTRSMLIRCVGLLVYTAAFVAATKRERIPVWLGTGLTWAAWGSATATGDRRAPRPPRFGPLGLRKTRAWEYGLRFVLGGVVTACTGLVVHAFGPSIGGLFLAFPAFLPASLTLVRQHDGRAEAVDDARG